MYATLQPDVIEQLCYYHLGEFTRAEKFEGSERFGEGGKAKT